MAANEKQYYCVHPDHQDPRDPPWFLSAWLRKWCPRHTAQLPRARVVDGKIVRVQDNG
jgi:hypothetical protein